MTTTTAARITGIDQPTTRMLRERLDAALKAAGLDAIGLSAEVGNALIGCGRTSVTFKVEVAVVAADGTTLNRGAQSFRQMATLYGLAPDDLGRTFAHQGRTFTITGLAARAGRMPILADRDDGCGFKFPAESVAKMLAAQARAAGAERAA
jgi:hypothetical protein